jgi:hypothetical protein
MRVVNLMGAVVATLIAGAVPVVSLGQSCGLAPTMPYRALVRPIGDDNVAADMSIAAGLSRALTVTNSGVRIHCKSGYAMTSQTPLNGTDANNSAFAETTNSFAHNSTFDPRVIYDGYDGRFWMVAAERDVTGETIQGRLHISVSGAGTSDGEAPPSWSSTYWVKFTGDGPTGAAGPSLDPSNSTEFSPDHFSTDDELGGHFPDRPTIAVDRDFLYISVREGTSGHNASQDRMLLVVMCKADLEAGTPTVVTSQFFEAPVTTESVMHVLAVDSTIPESGVHRVYMVTLPDLVSIGVNGVGHHFDSIRVAAFTGSGTFGDCGDSLEWDYDYVDVPLDSADEFIGLGFPAPEAKGAADGVTPGLDAQTPCSLFMNAMTRTLGDGDRRIWCIHNILPIAQVETDISQLQWYQINLHDWPDSASPGPDFDRVERISMVDPYDHPLNVFDGAIAANECEDVAIGFTRGGYYNDTPDTWTYPQFWKALYPAGLSPTIAVLTAGTSQYYNPSDISDVTAWADYAGMTADPDPLHTSRFFGLHMTAHNDNTETGGDPGQRTKDWEAWFSSFTFGSCDSSFMADFDQDQDVDADDLADFQTFVSQDNLAADLDESLAIDALDLIIMLGAVGEEIP